VSGPRDPRHRRSENKTVEVPLRSAPGSGVPAEEPWWKNANTRVPPPPVPAPTRVPAPPRVPRPPQPQARRGDRPSQPQVRNRHGKSTPRRNRGQIALLSVIGVIAITAGAVGLMVGLSKFDVLKGKVLDVSKAEAGVQRILLDTDAGYSATNVSDVACNDGKDPEIKKGSSFTCAVVVDGRKRNVLVVFQDDNGTYEVDRPR
jgi:hypothetical protein